MHGDTIYIPNSVLDLFQSMSFLFPFNCVVVGHRAYWMMTGYLHLQMLNGFLGHILLQNYVQYMQRKRGYIYLLFFSCLVMIVISACMQKHTCIDARTALNYNSQGPIIYNLGHNQQIKRNLIISQLLSSTCAISTVINRRLKML